MKGLIDKVVTVYEMRANAMSVLMANTEKALGQFAPEKEKIANKQVKNLSSFVNFSKTLAKDIRSLTDRFEKTRGQTFEKKFDKEIGQMEAYVQNKLKGFDEALEETLTGTHNTWRGRLRQYVGKRA